MKNKKIFDEIYRTITENNSFFITSHINPDGDAIGSELAFFLFLKKLKKKGREFGKRQSLIKLI